MGRFEHGKLEEFHFSSSILSTSALVSANNRSDRQTHEFWLNNKL